MQFTNILFSASLAGLTMATGFDASAKGLSTKIINGTEMVEATVVLNMLAPASYFDKNGNLDTTIDFSKSADSADWAKRANGHIRVKEFRVADAAPEVVSHAEMDQMGYCSDACLKCRAKCYSLEHGVSVPNYA